MFVKQVNYKSNAMKATKNKSFEFCTIDEKKVLMRVTVPNAKLCDCCFCCIRCYRDPVKIEVGNEGEEMHCISHIMQEYLNLKKGHQDSTL